MKEGHELLTKQNKIHELIPEERKRHNLITVGISTVNVQITAKTTIDNLCVVVLSVLLLTVWYSRTTKESFAFLAGVAYMGVRWIK